MKINEIREAIKSVFPYKKWYQRVAKMTDSQVLATFYRLKREGKL